MIIVESSNGQRVGVIIRQRTSTMDSRPTRYSHDESSSSSSKLSTFLDSLRPRSKSDAAKRPQRKTGYVPSPMSMSPYNQTPSGSRSSSQPRLPTTAEVDENRGSSTREDPVPEHIPLRHVRVLSKEGSKDDGGGHAHQMMTKVMNIFRGRSSSSATAEDKHRLLLKVR
eukprot:TCALIF_11734-PA protein Name:"Protein of unknown function" AED:0.35 eAED:0.35 QI:0/0.5/0.33/0.66/0.5/0.66/3/0/168